MNFLSPSFCQSISFFFPIYWGYEINIHVTDKKQHRNHLFIFTFVGFTTKLRLIRSLLSIKHINECALTRWSIIYQVTYCYFILSSLSLLQASSSIWGLHSGAFLGLLRIRLDSSSSSSHFENSLSYNLQILNKWRLSKDLAQINGNGEMEIEFM